MPGTQTRHASVPRCYADEHHLVWPKKELQVTNERETAALPEHPCHYLPCRGNPRYRETAPQNLLATMLQAIMATALQGHHERWRDTEMSYRTKKHNTVYDTAEEDGRELVVSRHDVGDVSRPSLMDLRYFNPGLEG